MSIPHESGVAPPSSAPSPPRPASLHGWSFVEEARKREIIDALCAGAAPPGPVHAELDLTDRCNVACYFCNQMDVRTKDALPYDQVEGLVEELVAGGLRSVRLSGGGDPLMYPEIVRVFDLLGERGVVVDNLTTNAARLGPEVADRLVRHGAREVMVSLNAIDKLDYHRMLRVAPRIFDTVLENVRHLVALRGDAPAPAVTVQFLVDRENYRRMAEMVALGTSLGVDRIAINAVLDIPNQRLNEAPLLWPGDRELVRPFLRRALEEDLQNGDGLLHLSFPWEPWNLMVDELRLELEGAARRPYPVSEGFRPDLDHCFFGWYSAAIRGTGEMYPCCMLINPEYEPIGDLRQGSVTEQWHGEGFTRLRQEMREVFLRDGRIDADGMAALRPQCVEAGRCGLKSMYFRADDAFYRQLGEAMDRTRRREVSWRGGWRGLRRAAGVFAYRARWAVVTRWTRLRQRWHRLRARRLPWLVREARVHVGRQVRAAAGPLEGWMLVGLEGVNGAGPDGRQVDRTIAPGEPIPYRRARAIHAERVLEALAPAAARAFLRRVREALAEGGVLRLVTEVEVVPIDPGVVTSGSVGRHESHGPLSNRLRWSATELEHELRAAGFIEVERYAYGRSPHPWLRNLEASPIEPAAESVEDSAAVQVMEAKVPPGAFPFDPGHSG